MPLTEAKIVTMLTEGVVALSDRVRSPLCPRTAALARCTAFQGISAPYHTHPPLYMSTARVSCPHSMLLCRKISPKCPKSAETCRCGAAVGVTDICARFPPTRQIQGHSHAHILPFSTPLHDCILFTAVDGCFGARAPPHGPKPATPEHLLEISVTRR